MAKKKVTNPDKDQAISDLEEMSDLISEVGTSLADQDMDTAQSQWNDILSNFKALSETMANLFQEEDEDTND